MKLCTLCKLVKEPEAFYKHKDYLSGRCKDCTKSFARSPAGRAMGDRNDTSIKGRYRELRAAANKRGWDMDFTLEEYAPLAVMQCHYCTGGLPKYGHGLDRKDTNKGYVHGNVVPCCKYCNKTKGDLWTYLEFLKIAEAIREIKARRAS